MKFPERSDTHIIEAESWRLLQSLAPREWIVREVSERDYGIDAYIELVSKGGQVTGSLCPPSSKACGKSNGDPLIVGFALQDHHQ
jgi:hypothetical protein